MKTEIKSKVQKVLTTHNEVKQSYAKLDEEIKALENDTIYEKEYRIAKIQELKLEKMEALTNIAKLFNKQLQEVIQEEKKSILGIFSEHGEKPADYQVQISNALKFLELAGDNLTNDQVYNILKPFQTDFETMKLFKAIVDKQNKDKGILNFDKFSNTFEKTNIFNKLVKSFEDAEKLSQYFFDPRVDSLTDRIKGDMFMSTIEEIENLVSKLDAA